MLPVQGKHRRNEAEDVATGRQGIDVHVVGRDFSYILERLFYSKAYIWNRTFFSFNCIKYIYMHIYILIEQCITCLR